MSTFSEYYEKPESNLSGILIEARVKTKSKSMTAKALSRLVKFFGKKSEKVNPSKIGNIEKITKTGFNDLTNKLSNSILSKSKTDDDYYVKSIFDGKLSTPKEIDPDWKSTKSSTIFKTNNGGKIYLFSFEDMDGKIVSYVAANDKMNSWFIDKTGKTYSLYVSSKLAMTGKKKAKLYNVKLASDPDDEYDDDTTTHDTNVPTISADKDIDKETDKEIPKVGLLNIEDIDFDQMVDMWGNGRVGYGLYSNTYKYKGTLTRKDFSNNWGNGYEYTFPGGNKIYLIQNHDDVEKGFVVFDSQTSVNKAKELSLIPWLAPGVKLYWKNLDINNMEA